LARLADQSTYSDITIEIAGCAQTVSCFVEQPVLARFR
jgi:hypothetical protein